LNLVEQRSCVLPKINTLRNRSKYKVQITAVNMEKHQARGESRLIMRVTFYQAPQSHPKNNTADSHKDVQLEKTKKDRKGEF
jgi:hypothetical protein